MNKIRMTAEQTRIWEDGDYPRSERMMRTLRQRARDIVARAGRTVEIVTADGIVADEVPLVDIRDQAVLDDIADDIADGE
jgi:hypothetical protein